MTYSHAYLNSPAGKLKLVASEKGLAAILWEKDKEARVKLPESLENPKHAILVKAGSQLAEYFAGKRKSFDIDLDPAGTAFQKRVWSALSAIPFGEVRSYSDISKKIGCPGGMRAVGAASGRNPNSIVVPCHRVIGADGNLTGFAGGLENKEYLLKLERAQLPSSQMKSRRPHSTC